MPPRKKKEETQPKVKTQVYASRAKAADNYNFASWDLLPNPDRILEKLGMDQYTAYKDVATDEQVTAVSDSRETAVKNMNWKIVQGESSESVYEFTKTNFSDLDIDEFISHVLVANGWGMAPIEVIWNTMVVPGKAYVEQLLDRPARWFSFSDTGELRFLSKKSPLYGEDIPNRKILLPRNKPTTDNPYGEALYSKSYWMVYFKRNSMKWWNQLVEKYGFPTLIGESAPNLSETDTDELLEMMTNIVQGSVGTVPDITKIEFKESGSQAKSEMFLDNLNYMNASIAKLWLGQTLTTELSGDVGSFAASKTHQGVKDERKKSDQKMVETVANQLCRWICEINFPNDIPCTFVLEEPATINKEEAERDAILSTSLGVRFTKQSISTRYHLNEEEFEVVDPSPQYEPRQKDEKEELTQWQATVEQIDKNALFQSVRFKDQKGLDSGIDSLVASKKTLSISKSLIKPIEAIINDSDNYEDALINLTKAWPDMDVEELEEVLTTALLVSNTQGHLGAKAKT